MKLLRGALLLVGVLMGLWGLWSMRDFSLEQFVSLAIFVVAGIVIHDGFIAPLTVGAEKVGSGLLPIRIHRSSALAFLVWGTVTITVLNVLSGQGGKPDNDTLLNRPYVMWWLIFTALVVVVALLPLLNRTSGEESRPARRRRG